jgi:photosystem II stability/assembly factor-like uncharacterized protein
MRRGTAVGAASLVGLLVLAVVGCARREPPEPWQVVEIPTAAECGGLWFADSLNGWITGGGFFIDGGIVGRTRDGGLTWTFVNPLPPGETRPSSRFVLRRVQFLDTLRGVAVADRGLVLVTRDGGAFWRPAEGRSPSRALFDVQFLDEDLGWAVGLGEVMVSGDGGQSWSSLAAELPEDQRIDAIGVHFIDAGTGYAVGMNGAAWRTSDGGRSWTPIELEFDAGNPPRLNDVFFCDQRHGWIVGERGHVFHSADGGWTWTRQREGIPRERPRDPDEPPPVREPLPELEGPAPELFLAAVHFAGPARGWVVGHYPNLAHSLVLGTRDGGATWQVERSLRGDDLRAVFALDSTRAWAIGDRTREGRQQLLRYRPVVP